jgi:hypothetical protein
MELGAQEENWVMACLFTSDPLGNRKFMQRQNTGRRAEYEPKDIYYACPVFVPLNS